MDKCKNVYVRLNGNLRKECLSLTGRTREGFIGEVKLKLNLEEREGVFQAYKVVGKKKESRQLEKYVQKPRGMLSAFKSNQITFSLQELTVQIYPQNDIFLRMT